MVLREQQAPLPADASEFAALKDLVRSQAENHHQIMRKYETALETIPSLLAADVAVDMIALLRLVAWAGIPGSKEGKQRKVSP